MQFSFAYNPVKVSIFSDTPPGLAPAPATNLTLSPEAGGWVLRWIGDLSDQKLLYYTVQVKGISQGDKWAKLTDSKIDKEEASYLSKYTIIL